MPTCHLTMVRSHCVINSWKMGLVVFGVIVCQCGYFNPSNDNPTNISGFLGPSCEMLFYPPFLDATKTKKTHERGARHFFWCSGGKLAHLSGGRCRCRSPWIHGRFWTIPKIVWKIFPPPPSCNIKKGDAHVCRAPGFFEALMSSMLIFRRMYHGSWIVCCLWRGFNWSMKTLA